MFFWRNNLKILQNCHISNKALIYDLMLIVDDQKIKLIEKMDDNAEIFYKGSVK